MQKKIASDALIVKGKYGMKLRSRMLYSVTQRS